MMKPKYVTPHFSSKSTKILSSRAELCTVVDLNAQTCFAWGGSKRCSTYHGQSSIGYGSYFPVVDDTIFSNPHKLQHSKLPICRARFSFLFGGSANAKTRKRGGLTQESSSPLFLEIWLHKFHKYKVSSLHPYNSHASDSNLPIFDAKLSMTLIPISICLQDWRQLAAQFLDSISTAFPLRIQVTSAELDSLSGNRTISTYGLKIPVTFREFWRQILFCLSTGFFVGFTAAVKMSVKNEANSDRDKSSEMNRGDWGCGSFDAHPFSS